MDREPVLPRRSLSVGAVGHGAEGRRYRILAPLDRGGMGELFLAEARAPGEPTAYVVIKRLLADLLDDDKYVAMFRAEAEVMARLAHPGIVAVYDLPVFAGAQCFAMEYVRGRNLHQIIARAEQLGARVPPAVGLAIMARVLEALEHAHTFHLADGTPLNLVHRDVSPGNILVSFSGEVKLTDFGIAKSQISAVSTTVGIVKGKARYLAPEQILGEAATPRSDVFSAASVTAELLTGKPTFEQQSVPRTLYAIVNGMRADLEQALAFRAPLLIQVLNRALATDPKARTQSARELAEGLMGAARLLARPGERGSRSAGAADPAAIGAWLTELFAEVPDPLAEFGDAPTREVDRPTVQGYPANAQVELEEEASSRDTEQRQPTEVLPRRLRAEPIAVDDAVHTGEPVAAAPLPPLEDDTVANVRAPVLPTAPLPEAKSAVILRGQPLPPEAPEPLPSVDEALAALAWIQAQKPAPEPPPPRERAPTTVLRAPPRAPLFLGGFGLGILAGAILTLGLQAAMRPSPDERAQRGEGSWAGPASPRSALAPPSDPEARSERGRLDPAPAGAGGQREPGADAEGATEPPLVAPPPLPAPAPAPAEPTAIRPVVLEATASLDVLAPRGARVSLDGEALEGVAPLRGLSVRPGRRTLRVVRGKLTREVVFEAEPGARFELGPKRLRRLD